MARFRLFLIGCNQPLEVDLPVSGVAELNQMAATCRFLEGYMAEADGDGVCPGVLIPTSRLQMVVEASS